MLLFNDLIFLKKNKADTLLCKNSKWIDYKLKKSLEERINESQNILKKYPDKIPVIINECNEDLRDRIKRKILLQKDMTASQYIYSLRSKFNIKQEESLLLFINGSMPTSTTLMSHLYEKNKDKDGFLYVSILKENAFGR